MTSLLLLEKTEYALIEDGRLVECGCREDREPRTESLYIGRLTRRLSGRKAGFVRLADRQEAYIEWKNGDRRPGDLFPVQVKRPQVGAKQPLVTDDIALTGHFLVYLPFAEKDTVSLRVADAEKKARLKAFLAGLPRPQGAFVGRSALDEAAFDAARMEAEALTRAVQAMENRSAPRLVFQGPSRLERLLRDLKSPVDRIIADAPFEAAGRTAELSDTPFLLYNVRAEKKRALSRLVRLKSGGTLVIDLCEALTVIDVNLGQSDYQGEEGLVRLNREAAAEIARLLRLRNLGGIILIDFINMKGGSARKQVQQALEEALMKDPAKTTVEGFTRLGLMEMTRRRTQDNHCTEEP